MESVDSELVTNSIQKKSMEAAHDFSFELPDNSHAPKCKSGDSRSVGDSYRKSKVVNE